MFDALALAAAELELEATWVAQLTRAKDDETRHARLCAAAGEVFGSSPPRFDRSLVNQRLADLAIRPPLDKALSLALFEVAIGETISCGLFQAGSASATEPLTRWTLTEILRDEATHAQLGWNLLSHLVGRLTGADHDRLPRELATGLASIERMEAIPSLRRLEKHVPFDARLSRFGVLDPETRISTFYRVLETRVLPNLDRLGLNGSVSWSRRYRWAP